MTVPQPQAERRSTRFLDWPLRRAVWRRLEMVKRGRLVVEDGQGRGEPLARRTATGFAATLHVRDPRFYQCLVLDGSLGAAEAYIRGYWSCDDLVGLVRIFCQNPAVSAAVEGGPARLLGPLRRLAHLLRRNTTAGSRRNIEAHYDLGNDFFAAVPRRDDGLFLRNLPAAASHAPRGVAGQVRPHLSQAGPDGG